MSRYRGAAASSPTSRRARSPPRALRSPSPGPSSRDAVSAIETPRVPTPAIARPTWLDRVRARPNVRTAVAAALPVGFVTVLLFVPYVLLLVQSFWRLKGGVITHELTLENYRRLFGTELYPNTILFSAG